MKEKRGTVTGPDGKVYEISDRSSKLINLIRKRSRAGKWRHLHGRQSQGNPAQLSLTSQVQTSAVFYMMPHY